MNSHRDSYFFQKGAALVVAISLIVILSGLVIALLSRALNKSTVASDDATKLKMVSAWGETAVVSDLIEEMVAGSDLVAMNDADIDHLLKPASERQFLPQVSLRQKLGENAYIRDFRFKNLLKQSQSGVPNFIFGDLASPSKASPIPTTPHLSPSEWNAPFLIPKEYEATAGVPDWVYLDEFGDFVQTNGTTREISGRYAYRVYDLGSLINANISGFPSNATEQDYSAKSSPLWIDLTRLPGFTPDFVDNLSNWKYPSMTQVWGKGNDNEEVSPIREQLEEGWLHKTSGLYSLPEGNTFTSRQEMIAFFRDQKQDPNSLNFVTHYSYSSPSVHYFPDERLPQIEFSWSDGGNDVFQNEQKPLTERINTAPALHRNKDGAIMSQKFPLEKIALLSEAIPGEAYPEAKAFDVKRLFGLEWSEVDNAWEYLDPEIKTLAEYAEESPRRPSGHTGYWGPNFFEVLKAAIHVGSLGRQMNNVGNLPNDLIITLGNVSIDAVGGATARDVYTNFPNFDGRHDPRHTFFQEDGIIDFQLFNIGLNIIDQWDEDSFPTRIMHDGRVGLRFFNGIEDLPKLYGSIVRPYGTGYIPTGIGNPRGASANGHRPSLWSTWFLQPIIWNPHAPKKQGLIDDISEETTPTLFRVTANTAPVRMKLSSVTPNALTALGYPAFPEDYEVAEPFAADFTDGIDPETGNIHANFADLSVRYSSNENDTDAFAALEFTVNTDFNSPGSFRDPQLIASDNYPVGSVIRAIPDREDIPFDLTLTEGFPFSLAQSDARMEMTDIDTLSIDLTLTVDNEFNNDGIFSNFFAYNSGYPATYTPLENAWVSPTRWMRETWATSNQNDLLSQGREDQKEQAFYDRNGDRNGLPAILRQSVVGFRLMSMPTIFNASGSTYGAHSKIFCDSSSLHLEYFRNGQWVEYDRMDGVIVDEDISQNGSEHQMTLRADARASRWGTFPTRTLLTLNTSNSPHRLNNWVGSFSPYGKYFDISPGTTAADLTEPNFSPLLWLPQLTGAGNINHWTFGESQSWLWPPIETNVTERTSIASLQWNDSNDSATHYNMGYQDPDGIQRRAIAGDLLQQYDSFRLGQPLFDRDPQDPATFKDDATQFNFRSRPIILDRPFNSVAEMGYAFRDVAFKHLDFMMPESGDKALLDFFSLREIKESPITGEPVQAGLVELNTPHVEILEAILSGAKKIEDPDNSINSSSNNTLTAADVSSLAEILFDNGEDNNYLGYQNHSDLISKYNGTGNTYNDFLSVSPDIAQYFGPIDGRLKRRFESVVRALTANTSTGTWNVMIDIVAQSGQIKTGSSLNSFSPRGQKRRWVYLTIERMTGKVLHRSEEIVF